MTDFATLTLADHVSILAGSSDNFHFRPGQPGPISIRTAPEIPRAHSETGFLGQVELLRPGQTTPARATPKARIGETIPPLTYMATAADLAIAGDWTCRVTNFTDVTMVFATDVTFVSGFALLHATFDLGLLQIMLSEAVAAAAIRIHLETSESDDSTVVTLAPTIAQLLKLSSVEQRLHIDDSSYDLSTTEQIVGGALAVALAPFLSPLVLKAILAGGKIPLRVVGLDSDPGYPTIYLSTDPLAIVLTIVFLTQGAKIEVLGYPLPDVEIDQFTIVVNFGFDGTITPQCQAKAILPLPGYPIDVSSTVQSKVEDKVKSFLTTGQAGALLGPDALKRNIESFFVRLMRLSAPAALRAPFPQIGHILQYRVNGQTLTVDYYLASQIVAAQP